MKTLIPAFLLLLLVLSGCINDHTIIIDEDANTEDVNGMGKVSEDDQTADYHENKFTAGTNITLTTLNPGGVETLEIAASGGGNDTNCHNDPNCNIVGTVSGASDLEPTIDGNIDEETFGSLDFNGPGGYCRWQDANKQFCDLFTNQTIKGIKTFEDEVVGNKDFNYPGWNVDGNNDIRIDKNEECMRFKDPQNTTPVCLDNLVNIGVDTTGNVQFGHPLPDPAFDPYLLMEGIQTSATIGWVPTRCGSLVGISCSGKAVFLPGSSQGVIIRGMKDGTPGLASLVIDANNPFPDNNIWAYGVAGVYDTNTVITLQVEFLGGIEGGTILDLICTIKYEERATTCVAAPW